MTKVATTITVGSNNPLKVEDAAVHKLLPLLKSAIFPGTSVLPERNLVVIIEVLEQS